MIWKETISKLQRFQKPCFDKNLKVKYNFGILIRKLSVVIYSYIERVNN